MKQISVGASDDGMIIGVILVVISCRLYLVQPIVLQVSAAFFLFPSEVEVEVNQLPFQHQRCSKKTYDL